MLSSKTARRLASVFKPPFEGLGLVVWIYFAWCFIAHPYSPIMRGDLIDPDDYTYLSHILDWLRGQSWFDAVQYRLSPPEGTPIHFSRLAELPVAGLISVMHAAGLSWLVSATIAAAVWPLVLLAGLLAALRWVAAGFLPRNWTGATAYVALFATPLLFQYSPGRVDHHGLAALITLLAFGCTLRMMQEPENFRWPLFSGLLLALGQAVALETLPWLLLLSAWIVLWTIVIGRTTAKAGLIFGLSLYLASFLCLAATRLPSQWFDPDPLAYSIVYVLLANSIAVCCAGVALASKSRLLIFRFAIGGVLGIATAAFFFSRFPELLTGPYGAVDKTLARLLFDNIIEMQPSATSPVSLASVLLPLTAFLVSLGLLPRMKEKDLWPQWMLSFTLLTAAVLLAAFYQVRYASYAVLFGIVPLTEFLRRSLAWASLNFRGRKLAATELGLILLVGPLPAVLLPAMLDGRSFNTGVLLFPVRFEKDACDFTTLESALNDPQRFGGKSRVIMNTINEGSEILFRTRHQVLAAPYHTGVSGLLDAVHFFTARSPDDARKIANARRAELVVLCHPLSAIYHSKAGAKTAKNTEDQPPPPGETFAEALVRGEVPLWLKPVKLPRKSPFLVFEIAQAAKATP
ncbi:MAG: hypothetical protein PHY92_02705 [Alphaproteobacteria bacterium]|nr:hypothetical protein [Alphaproteobacteria bacterium]